MRVQPEVRPVRSPHSKLCKLLYEAAYSAWVLPPLTLWLAVELSAGTISQQTRRRWQTCHQMLYILFHVLRAGPVVAARPRYAGGRWRGMNRSKTQATGGVYAPMLSHLFTTDASLISNVGLRY